LASALMVLWYIFSPFNIRLPGVMAIVLFLVMVSIPVGHLALLLLQRQLGLPQRLRARWSVPPPDDGRGRRRLGAGAEVHRLRDDADDGAGRAVRRQEDGHIHPRRPVPPGGGALARAIPAGGTRH